jgi:hypothetical protein
LIRGLEHCLSTIGAVNPQQASKNREKGRMEGGRLRVRGKWSGSETMEWKCDNGKRTALMIG